MKKKIIYPLVTILVILGLNNGLYLGPRSTVDFEGASYVSKLINYISEGSWKDKAESIGARIGEFFIKIIGKDTNEESSTSIVNNPILVEANLVRVVDGDTIVVSLNGEEKKVRLIGIDTPESVHSDHSKNTVYGEYASDYTKDVLEDISTLYLEYDQEETDSFDRTLAYVWLSDDIDTTDNESISKYMLNGKLLADGYALDKVYKPNVKYADLFNDIRLRAEANKIGLWNYMEFCNLYNNPG